MSCLVLSRKETMIIFFSPFSFSWATKRLLFDSEAPESLHDALDDALTTREEEKKRPRKKRLSLERLQIFVARFKIFGFIIHRPL